MDLLSEVVELRDGKKITVTEANWPADICFGELERIARENPDKDPSRQFYNLMIYPKLAACSSGDVPVQEEAYLMPSVLHEKWYAAAKRLNPNWFDPLEKAAEKLTAEALKKKETKRTRSTRGSAASLK